MIEWVKYAIAACLAFAMTMPAYAQDMGEDEVALQSAVDALKDNNLKKTVAEVDKVISRFEKGKKADADYQCGNDMADTLSILLGAALFAESGSDGNDTIIVSSNICFAYFLKGFALIDLDKREQALRPLEIAVEMDPDDQHYLNELAEWHKVDENWNKSLQLFTQASELYEPSDDEDLKQMQCRSLRGIGFNQIELDDFDAAKAALNRCLDLIPSDRGSLSELDYIRHSEWKRK